MNHKTKQIENYEGGLVDPTLSFHQRYARAVGARIHIEVTTSDVQRLAVERGMEMP